MSSPDLHKLKQYLISQHKGYYLAPLLAGSVYHLLLGRLILTENRQGLDAILFGACATLFVHWVTHCASNETRLVKVLVVSSSPVYLESGGESAVDSV